METCEFAFAVHHHCTEAAEKQRRMGSSGSFTTSEVHVGSEVNCVSLLFCLVAHRRPRCSVVGTIFRRQWVVCLCF